MAEEAQIIRIDNSNQNQYTREQLPAKPTIKMYPALLKHQIVKPSAFHISRIARASVSGKTQPSAKGSEECTL